MSEAFQIDTGSKSIVIEVDKTYKHEIKFNPHDIVFVEKLHQLYFDAKEKAKEYQALDIKDPVVDENGMAMDISQPVSVTKEMNNWFRGKLDELLGEGTAKALFGDTVYTPDKVGVYAKVIEAIMSQVEPVRKDKVKQFVKPSKHAGGHKKVA